MNGLLRFFLLPVVSLSIFLFSQPVIAAGEEQQPSEPFKLKMVMAPFLSYGPYFMAEEEGFFAEQGIKVEYVKMTEEVALQATAMGEVDVWPGIITVGFLTAVDRGADIRIVAEKGHFARAGCPSFGLLARKDVVKSAKMGDLKILKGRHFDVKENSFEEYFLDTLLSQAGLKPNEIKKSNVPPPAQLGALAKGRVDFMVATEPWITRIIKAGHGVLWKRVQEVIPDFDYAFVKFGPRILNGNAEAGRRYMVAYLQGVRQYNQGATPRNLEIMAKHTRLDKNLLREACWPQIRDDAKINPQGSLDFQDWAVAKGLLNKQMPLEKIWEPRFVEYANGVLKSKQ